MNPEEYRAFIYFICSSAFLMTINGLFVSDKSTKIKYFLEIPVTLSGIVCLYISVKSLFPQANLFPQISSTPEVSSTIVVPICLQECGVTLSFMLAVGFLCILVLSISKFLEIFKTLVGSVVSSVQLWIIDAFDWIKRFFKK